jgi:two-component system, OmpR family, sensor histidine kinase CpxA
MQRLRVSLFAQIIFWFFLNLLFLAALLWLFFSFRFDPRLPSFLRSGTRIESITGLVEEETNNKTRAERDEILQRYTQIYNVEFFLFDNAGRQLAGREIALPEEIRSEITRFEPPPGARRGLNPRLTDAPSFRPPFSPSPRSLYLRTANPSLYWFVGRIMTFDSDKHEATRTRLLAASDSFTGRGLFFNPLPYLFLTGAVIGFSILFWLPFVRRITRAVGQMNDAAAQIAEERFDVRVDERRTDELGRLGKSINHLAARLSGFVTGQKRFLGDISHELNSPLARMQFALTILEDRVDESNRAYVADVREEVELMTKLVSELLAYSKAGIKSAEVKLENVSLRPLVERVVERETATENAKVKIEINENLNVQAQPELLDRALANVVRNAVRYAGEAGEITIAANQNNGKVELTVADQGAGVPEAEIDRLFDPFYRLETDRSRQTGGSGLGLAIVKTCVEACRGKVLARKRIPNGLEISINLQSSKPTE